LATTLRSFTQMRARDQTIAPRPKRALRAHQRRRLAGRAKRMREVMPGVECVYLRVCRNRYGPVHRFGYSGAT
jgi:hypothetical protein